MTVLELCTFHRFEFEFLKIPLVDFVLSGKSNLEVLHGIAVQHNLHKCVPGTPSRLMPWFLDLSKTHNLRVAMLFSLVNEHKCTVDLEAVV